jgi:hypothetical protein
MSALIAYEPTQDSEVLADTVENDGSGFWIPNLYICVAKSRAILLGMLMAIPEAKGKRQASMEPYFPMTPRLRPSKSRLM